MTTPITSADVRAGVHSAVYAWLNANGADIAQMIATAVADKTTASAPPSAPALTEQTSEPTVISTTEAQSAVLAAAEKRKERAVKHRNEELVRQVHVIISAFAGDGAPFAILGSGLRYRGAKVSPEETRLLLNELVTEGLIVAVATGNEVRYFPHPTSRSWHAPADH